MVARGSGKGFYEAYGYRFLTSQYGHPLVRSNGVVPEHRKVLYDKIGPGPHTCYWNDLFGCGKTDLIWGGGKGVCVDHLDDDQLNNDPDNLVPTCQVCNALRSKFRPEVIVAVRVRHAAGEPVKDLAVEFGAGRSNVSRMINRRTWSNYVS